MLDPPSSHPPPSAYEAALTLLRPLPRRHLWMLQRHYHAPERTVTARQLAALVGYRHYGSANLQYGTLARRICEILGFRFDYSVLILVDFSLPESSFDRELRWVMRPELATALENLGWTKEQLGR